MDKHRNVYYTFNRIFDGAIPKFRVGEKADFVAAMRDDWDLTPEIADEMYRPMIEAHTDRFMRGMDRGTSFGATMKTSDIYWWSTAAPLSADSTRRFRT